MTLHHGAVLHLGTAAREGERRETPPKLETVMHEMGKLKVGESSFFDLSDPWMHSPA